MRRSRIGMRKKKRQINIMLIIFFFIILPITAVTIGSRITEWLVIPTINTENMLQAPGNMDIENPSSPDNNSETEVNSNEEEADKKELNIENVKLNSLLVYAIQVASLSNDSNIESFTTELENYNFPHIIYKIDDVYKVYTYGSTKRENIENKLDIVREVYPDAYIDEMYISEKKVEYSEDVEANVKDVISNINSLINIMDQSSDKLYEFINKESSLEKYNQTLVKHKEILELISEDIGNINEDTGSINIMAIKNMIEYQNQNIEKTLNMKDDMDELRLYNYFLDNLFRIIELLKNN